GESRAETRTHVTLNFVGGNTGRKSSSILSNRDGYGAKITATLESGLVLYREHHCGAGMAAQNSNKMHLGIGTSSSIKEMKVVWPSGKTQTLENIQPGSVHEIRESGE
ncbi:MAG: ASPIC/UnbV domain-containing protein, partial [Verrucomicrobiales bacterium]